MNVGVAVAAGFNKRKSGIPFKSDSLFWLDGTILYSAPNYYFVDKSGNGRNFLITGYDFDTAWTKGFPYKSAATISAPTGDATLIAADINNYLYAAGGTPNAIPVVSLFQDVDYEHKLFCRHEAQVIDGNGVETYEPRVKDIVLYTNVKSGADLTKCQSYYGVPVEDANAKWIDPIDGVDATGNGTKTTPYKTIAKVETLTLTAGTQIYIKSGIETYYLLSSKGYKYKAIGLFTLTSSDATFWIRLSNDNAAIEGFISGSAKAIGINSSKSVYVNKCKPLYTSFGITTSNGATTITIENSIFISGNKVSIKTDALNYACIFRNNYCNDMQMFQVGNSTGCNATVNNNKYKYTSGAAPFMISFSRTNNITATGNKCNGALMFITDVADATGNISLKYNNCVAVSAQSFVYSSMSQQSCNYTWDISHNIFTCGAFGIGSIFLKSQQNMLVSYNTCTSFGATTFASLIDVTSTTRVCNNVIIRNNSYYTNVVNTSNAPLAIIIVGDQENTSTNDKMDGTIIEYNKVIGKPFYGGGNTNAHAVFITRTKNSIVRYNLVYGFALGIVFKRGTFGHCYGNIVKDCNVGIDLKNHNDTVVYGNTIINAINDSYELIIIVVDDNLTPNLRATIKNNILYNSSTNAAAKVYSYDGTCADNVIDYNSIYSYNEDFALNNTTATGYNESEWQALGFDTHSIMLPTLAAAKALFTDYDNGDYSLVVGSTAIGIGVDLGATYDDGLDASTNWGTDTQLPVVVTKQQGANWDIGAYIH